MLPTRKTLKSSGPLISPSCDRPGLRMFLLCCIFALTVSAYWWNFEQRMAKIQPPDGSHRVLNEDNLLGKSELKFLQAWRTKFQKEWNVHILVQVSAGPLELPPYPASTLYMGVGLAHTEAVIAMPGLVRKALGEGLRLEAEEELSLCLKNSSAITEYVQAQELTATKDAEGIQKNVGELSNEEKISAAATATTQCLDATLNKIWDAL